MYLEKIEIFGFKSFADKTTIHFSKPVTAIVGPNGCGKSNVVDAFRWVLGGPTAKALRSDKMTDVIFSGTAKRSPLNYAQISLTFTNIKQSLSVDYQEICITRRLYRTGESEWLVNRNPARLKDIHQLLWEAGLGKNAFYIFEQGKIDDLIMSTPYERRDIFEEAAKIMHFKEKRKEAFRKLGQVETNLKRVLDIQAEVNKQIETLQKQAEEAQIYKKQKDELEKLDQELIIAKWQENDKKQTELKAFLKEKAFQQSQIKTQITEIEENLKTHKISYQEQSELAKKAYENFFEFKKAKELVSFEFKTHQKKLEEILEQGQHLKQALQQFHQKHLQEHKVYLANQDKLKTHQNDLSTLTEEHHKSFSFLEELEKRVHQESIHRKESQSALMKTVNFENDLQMQLGRATSQLDNTLERQTNLLEMEKEATHRLSEKQALLDSFALSHTESQKALQETQQSLEEVHTLLLEQKEQMDSLKEAFSLLSDKITSKNAKVGLLQKLKDEFDGYGRATKKLLESSKNPSHSLFGKLSPLAEWINPEAGYETCLAALLGPYLQTIVTKSQQDLEVILSFAKEHNLQNFSILCIEHLSQQSAHQAFAKPNIVSNHFLSQVTESDVISGNSTSFCLINKEFFIDHKKVIHHLAQEKNNLFLRESELQSTYKELLILEQEKLELSNLLQEKQKNYDISLNEQKSLNLQFHKLNMALRESELKTRSLQEEIARLENNSKDFQEKRTSLSDTLLLLEKKQKETAELYHQEKDKRAQLESHFKKIENEFERNFQQLNEKRSLKQSLENRIKHIERDSQALNEAIKVFESKSVDFEDQIQKMNSQIESNENTYHKLSEESPSYQQKEKELTEKLTNADQYYHSCEDGLEKLEKEESAWSLKLSNLRLELESLQGADIEINNQSAQLQAENNLYFGEIFEKYQFEKEQILLFSIPEEFSIIKADRDVKRLRRSLTGFTEVNLKAVADCKEQQERFTFLQCQVDDLNQSKDKLVEVISELDNTSRQMFSETFENIRKHFKANYTLLFNGGEADLELNPNEDILEAGIEIIAQPPGKKMRSIQQMSGGEKCLTALALLFALFETQSIPFCILDEVDAPLDDTNIERFTRVLKQFVKNHQFIIITHNKRTMAMADILLGISMEEKGVTKVIPFEFNDQASPENTSTISA